MRGLELTRLASNIESSIVDRKRNAPNICQKLRKSKFDTLRYRSWAATHDSSTVTATARTREQPVFESNTETDIAG